MAKRWVAPFAGAWIEIEELTKDGGVMVVAPFAGAWIEIGWSIEQILDTMSLPSRERGLKF